MNHTLIFKKMTRRRKNQKYPWELNETRIICGYYCHFSYSTKREKAKLKREEKRYT